MQKQTISCGVVGEEVWCERMVEGGKGLVLPNGLCYMKKKKNISSDRRNGASGHCSVGCAMVASGFSTTEHVFLLKYRPSELVLSKID